MSAGPAPSLGYVVAGHQSLASTPGPTVLTWYYPLSDEAPAAARRRLLSTPLEDWQRMVRDDLLQDQSGPGRRDPPHRRLALGPCDDPPVPGLFWSGPREAAARPRPPLFFAHADSAACRCSRRRTIAG
jgi:hypothetical protein